MSNLQDLLGKRQFLQDKTVILDAIKKQRKFYFNNKPNIVFDRDTALLWFRNSSYSFYYNTIDDQLNSYNKAGVDGYKHWRLPTRAEFGKIIEPEFNHNENLQRSYCIDGEPFERGRRHHLLPCNSQLKPENYDTLTSDEKAQIVFAIFEINRLEAEFDNYSINDLLSKYGVKNFAFQKRLVKVQQQIDAEIKAQILSTKLDWRDLKNKFDIGANSSKVGYAVSLKNLTEYLIQKFDEYVYEKYDVIAELEKLYLQADLFPNNERVRADLENFYIDASNLYENLISAKNLQVLQTEQEKVFPSFNLVTEVLTEKVRRELVKVEFFEIMPDFVRTFSEYYKETKEFDHSHTTAASENVKLQLIKVLDFVSYLTEYTLEGHLRKKVDGLEVATQTLKKFCDYNKKLILSSSMSDEDLKSLTDELKQDLKEILNVLNDEEDFQWLRIKILQF